jgi:tRNA A37 threonylcarbamoyladenosine synthetase subunit TsaC/SUA5/YrdC
LTAAFGRPLIATSVTDAEELVLSDYYNESLSPDAWWTYGEEVLNIHGHEVAFFVDPGEPLPMRVSTIFDITKDTPVMVRDGGWDLGELTFDYVVANKE